MEREITNLLIIIMLGAFLLSAGCSDTSIEPTPPPETIAVKTSSPTANPTTGPSTIPTSSSGITVNKSPADIFCKSRKDCGNALLDCCNGECYNWTEELCCGNKVYPKIYYNSLQHCCGGEIYDWGICCNGINYDSSKYICCNNVPYTKEYSCCGYLVCEQGAYCASCGICCPTGYKCCRVASGAVCYDPKKAYCG